MTNLWGVITYCAKELKDQGKLTETQLMWAVMNEVTDEDLWIWGSDIVDVAEKVELQLAREGVPTYADRRK